MIRLTRKPAKSGAERLRTLSTVDAGSLFWLNHSFFFQRHPRRFLYALNLEIIRSVS